MRQFFTRNIGWKLLSLLIAVALWISVAREPEVATSITVPVAFKNPPDNLDIASNLPERVRIEIHGPSGRLTPENLAAVAVVLDVSDARPGERTYNIRGNNLNLPNGVGFDRAVPSQVTLRFDQFVVKEEPVQPVFINRPAGYRVTGEANPATVRIRGGQDRLQAINQINTDPIDLTAAASDSTFRTHLNIGDPQVRVLDPRVDITVRVKLQKMGGAH